jgi:hypothetical protein
MRPSIRRSAITARLPGLNMDTPPHITGDFAIRRIETAARVTWKPRHSGACRFVVISYAIRC